jgi:phosphomannomutase/phosphoglucomutase
MVEKEDFVEGTGKLIKKNIIEDYIKFILSKFDVKAPIDFEVVVDSGNGATGLIYPKVLKKIGLKVHELYCDPDGDFPHHIPDPSQRENLSDLQKKVVEVKAIFGFAYDGDGDRLGVVDENGNIVDNNKIFALLIKTALRKKAKSKVVYDALSSKMIEDVIRNENGIPIICKVGHTYITQKMIEEDAVLAGELSGHYYFKETYGADDALFASLMLIEYIIKTEKKLTEHFKNLPKYFSQATEGMRYPIRESEKFNFIEKLKRGFKNFGYEVDTIDGVKVIFKDGWALFRPSNTEPIISMSFEATTKEGFERIKNFVEDVIKTIPK